MPYTALDQLPPDTEEQANIVKYKGKLLRVKAFAGTGKTSTLIKYALHNPQDKILYLAFNRAIRDEAARKFPRNVVCKTAHQLAYAAFGRTLAHKLRNNLRLSDIMDVIPEHNWQLAKDVQAGLQNYIISADMRVLESHLPGTAEVANHARRRVMYNAQVLDLVQMAWNMMVDPNHSFPSTHDAYLKAFQLSLPDLSQQYTTILLDEAQDTNPVTFHIVNQQRCTLCLTGDSHQQIYRFRGASDMMNHKALESADTLYLTNSFRFGTKVATLANMLLMLKGEKVPVVGLGGEDHLFDKLPHDAGHRAIISRTVNGVIASALEAAKQGLPTYWVGGIDAYPLNDLVDLYWFSVGRKEHINNRNITANCQDYDEYQEMAKSVKDPEMLRGMSILRKNKNIPDIMDALRSSAVANEAEAVVTVCTAHRAKGLEFSNVELNDDFPDVLDPELEHAARQDEINLLYVACTRAQQALALNNSMKRVISFAQMKAQQKESA